MIVNLADLPTPAPAAATDARSTAPERPFPPGPLGTRMAATCTELLAVLARCQEALDRPGCPAEMGLLAGRLADLVRHVTLTDVELAVVERCAYKRGLADAGKSSRRPGPRATRPRHLRMVAEDAP